MKLDLIEKLWQTSYAVTGFAVIQAISYLYSTGRADIARQVCDHWLLVSGAIVIFHTIYVQAVYWCFHYIFSLSEFGEDKNTERAILNKIRLGQQSIVVLFGCFALIITYFLSHSA